MAVPAGDSIVEFRYTPASVRLGMVVTALASVVLAGLVVPPATMIRAAAR